MLPALKPQGGSAGWLSPLPSGQGPVSLPGGAIRSQGGGPRVSPAPEPSQASRAPASGIQVGTLPPHIPAGPTHLSLPAWLPQPLFWTLATINRGALSLYPLLPESWKFFPRASLNPLCCTMSFWGWRATSLPPKAKPEERDKEILAGTGNQVRTTQALRGGPAAVASLPGPAGEKLFKVGV